MHNDTRNARLDKRIITQTTMSTFHKLQQTINTQQNDQNIQSQIVYGDRSQERIAQHDESIHNNSTGQYQTEKDTNDLHLVTIKKLSQVEEQQREIEKVAEELITLKDIIRKLKLSIGGILQSEANGIEDRDITEARSEMYWDTSAPLASAIKRLQNINDRRITPQYKQWITQYFTKLFNDIKQIKSLYKSYEASRQRSLNPFHLNQVPTQQSQQLFTQQNNSYQKLIQYQIKCRLLQCVLKLCKYKGIFPASQFMKYSSELTIVDNQQLVSNLEMYKMTNISQKIKQLHVNSINSPEELFYQWKTIHDQLEIINLQEIQRFYIEKRQAAIYQNTYQNNENGILIIGGSGVGKTTLWLAMAGEKLIKKKIKTKDSEVQNYQAADEQMAARYKTSPFATSCTREPAKLQAPKKYTFPQQLCLIDTAGFEQSRSGQIDIMNTLYTYQTIQEMKKLRIIIVISEKNIGQRDQGLIKFAKHIARYFRDYQQVRESILFVLTKLQSAKRMKLACDNILKSVHLAKDSNQYKFIKHLQESIIYKECIDFRPTNENIIFDADYHIDPMEMDGKLKKLYKSLLKKFPIHHQYQNDYINLEYSRDTKDKLIQKKCYLENMIRKLYKEGDNSFRFYLEQLMFLENKVNKIQFTNNRGKYTQREGDIQMFNVLQVIDQINQEVILKFTTLVEEYFVTCLPQTLAAILQLKRKYSSLFLGSLEMAENIQLLEEDYHYVFQEITENINGLKLEFDRIVDEKQKEWIKQMKYKPKACHDIKKKHWLCAVVSFTKQYFNEDLPVEKIKQQQKGKKSTKLSKVASNIKPQLPYNKEFKSLLKTIKKNEDKFRQQFIEQLSLMDQQLANFLIKQSTESPPSDSSFINQTQKQLYQIFNQFKHILFHQQIISHSQPTISVPSDDTIITTNLQYIVSIIKQNLQKQHEEISSNIELMSVMRDNDRDISRSVWLEVQRFGQKVKLYEGCDRRICEVMEQGYKSLMKKVSTLVREIGEVMFTVIKKQDEQQIPVVIISNDHSSSISSHSKLQLIAIPHLSSHTLYNSLSKLNQLEEFPSIKQQLQFQIRCFNLKLKDYMRNLQKSLLKYDQKLSQFKRIVKNSSTPKNKSNQTIVTPQMYQIIKSYVKECIQLQHQITLVSHYFNNQQSQQEIIFQHLVYVKSLFYRHSRFLQSEKKNIRESHNVLLQNNITHELVMDYVILEQVYLQKIKLYSSHEIKKLHASYESSFDNQMEISNQFEEIRLNELKLLNECKQQLLAKLIDYPLDLVSPTLQQVQTEQFHMQFSPTLIQTVVATFLYYLNLKQLFEQLQTLNEDQQAVHDFRLIELDNICLPMSNIDETIVDLAGLLVTVTEIAQLKFIQLKQALGQVILDQFMNVGLVNYVKGCQILSVLFDKLEKSSVQGLEMLEDSLEEFKHKNLANQLKEFVDRCQSIFYRLSKNIDSIQLGHLDNVAEILEKPQSTKEFLKLLKQQCQFFVTELDGLGTLHSGVNFRLKELLKKMEESENQVDSVWEDELKQLQKTTNDPKNSLQKLIKLYEHHISKVSVQKTLEYRFVQLKKQQLADEIKEYLENPSPQQKVQRGQMLCEQLKNYLNFLKSMKLKMVVSINQIDEIKNIEQMQRLYEKEACRSQAGQRSQTDMTPSELRQTYLSVDYVHSKKQNSERYSVSDVKTSHFGVGVHERPIQRKTALKKSRHWDEKSNTSQTPMRNGIDNSFSSVIDEWSKQMALHTMQAKNNITKAQLSKSQSEIQIRTDFDPKYGPYHYSNKTIQMTASNDPTQRQKVQMTKYRNTEITPVDNSKRYTVNGLVPQINIPAMTQQPVVNNYINPNIMKKSAIMLKYAPPTLTYQHSDPKEKDKYLLKPTTPVTARTNSNNNQMEQVEKLQNSGSDQNLHTMKNLPIRMMSKHKTQQRIGY